MKHIALVTAWHTGTHTMENILMDQCDAKMNVWQRWGEKRNLSVNKRYLFNTHITPPEHYPRNQVDFTYRIIRQCYTYMPLRDPLAALVSRNTRGSNGKDNMIVDQYRMMLTFEGIEEIFPIESRTSMRLNPGPEGPMRDAYRAQDLRYIKANLPEFGYLKESEAVIRPYLESHGYKDLFWYE